MDHLNRGNLAEAADVLAQRVKAIQRAQEPKSGWDKAQLLELLPTTLSAAALEGEIALSA